MDIIYPHIHFMQIMQKANNMQYA